ncbi:MAG: TetR/AcrR family transcriptional regulator, partial [Methylobacteriaceae bacterium]|nr:TetR/AcrR family transcriptional regulator [Methylobacteriaceae bacterium]
MYRSVLKRTREPGEPAPRPGRPRAFDLGEAVERALPVFWRHGYEGASLTDLTAAMGISRPSLYAAFGDKAGLFRAVVDRYGEGPAAFVARALAEPTARAVVERFLLDGAAAQTDPAYPAGCLAVQGALACGTENAWSREILRERRTAVQAALADRLRQARDAGDLPADADPDDLSRFVATVFQGMAVQAASGASRAELEGIARRA